MQAEETRRNSILQAEQDAISTHDPTPPSTGLPNIQVRDENGASGEKAGIANADVEMRDISNKPFNPSPKALTGQTLAGEDDEKERRIEPQKPSLQSSKRTTLTSLVADTYHWSQVTFPTATTVLEHLPFALVPFAFCMFVLVQALVTKGWVPVFAHGWDHWVSKTGTVGAIGGMGFLSVILCNVSPFR